MRQVAQDHITGLEARVRIMDAALQRAQRARDERRDAERRAAVQDPNRRIALGELAAAAAARLEEMQSALETASAEGDPVRFGAAKTALARSAPLWREGASALLEADDPDDAWPVLDRLDTAGDEGCRALLQAEAFLGTLPGGSTHRAVLTSASDAAERAQAGYARAAGGAGSESEEARLHTLSEEALDLQRELAMERRRVRYRPEDHDQAQLSWLEAALERSEREHPERWRIVYLHHPLYTTIGNHCERPDVIGLRDNILELLQRRGRVHLVLSGHSHAFEWFRSDALPNAGIFVTGGGGQLTLRRSMLERGRLRRQQDRYEALRGVGVQECAFSGRGPNAADGVSGSIYHYLRVVVGMDHLQVHPIGVRWVRGGEEEERGNARTYRREEPMPVYHAPELPELPDRPALTPRALNYVEIRRDAPPRPVWG